MDICHGYLIRNVNNNSRIIYTVAGTNISNINGVLKYRNGPVNGNSNKYLMVID